MQEVIVYEKDRQNLQYGGDRSQRYMLTSTKTCDENNRHRAYRFLTATRVYHTRITTQRISSLLFRQWFSSRAMVRTWRLGLRVRVISQWAACKAM